MWQSVMHKKSDFIFNHNEYAFLIVKKTQNIPDVLANIALTSNFDRQRSLARGCCFDKP